MCCYVFHITRALACKYLLSCMTRTPSKGSAWSKPNSYKPLIPSQEIPQQPLAFLQLSNLWFLCVFPYDQFLSESDPLKNSLNLLISCSIFDIPEDNELCGSSFISHKSCLFPKVSNQIRVAGLQKKYCKKCRWQRNFIDRVCS